jgi:uncharacterized protein YdeI (YjbR/CyaY-like superfamily)
MPRQRPEVDDRGPLPTFFPTPAGFRRWLSRHHASATELWVGYRKKATGQASITWPESVDEALCFGWIDGLRKSIDASSYMIRFTPRRPDSTWSLVNVRRVAELTRLGRMKPAGVRAFDARDPGKSGEYSFEQREQARLSAAETLQFRANREAWAFFSSQPPGYRKLTVFWIASAKRDDTRARRLRTLIDDSAAGRRIGPLRRPGA